MKKKKFKIKITKRQLKIIKGAWLWLNMEQSSFYDKIRFIEEKLAEVTGIKDIEFFMADGEYVGVGNISRTMKLIDGEDLK